MSDPVKPPAEIKSDVPEVPPVEIPRGPDGGRLYTEAETEARVKDRLDRQRRALETQQKEAQHALETQKLEDQKEFEKLAKQRADEITALKPRASLAEGYEKRVAQLMAEASKALPSSLQMLLNKLPLQDQLDWLTENLESVKTPAVVSGSTNTNAWARTTNTAPASLTDDEYKARKRAESIYK